MTVCNGCLARHLPVDEMDVDYIETLLERWIDTSAEGWEELDHRSSGPHPLLGESALVAQGGCGEERHLVWQIGGRLFRKNGYYSSSSGTQWDGKLYQVFAREKTETVYE